MAKHIGQVTVALMAVMAFSMLSSILLGRTLSQADFGQFSLMRMLILFIPFIAVWGQGIATARFFSRRAPVDYQWPPAFAKIIGVSTIITAISVVIAQHIYALPLYDSFLLMIATVFFCSNLLLANLMRSQRRYTEAVLMENGFRALYFPLIGVVFLVFGADKQTAIYLYLGLVVVTGVGNIGFISRAIPSGEKAVPGEMHKTGLILMGIEVSVDILSSLDTLLIPKMLGYPALGLYSATLVSAQFFNLLARAAKYVWVPEFGRAEKSRFRLLTIAVFLIASLLAFALILGATPLLHLLFRGKYDGGAALLRVLTLSGVFRLMYSLSSSLIVGRLGQKALLIHLYQTLFSLMLYMILLYFLLLQFGLIGAAWALLITTSLRATMSYWIVLRYRSDRRESDGR